MKSEIVIFLNPNQVILLREVQKTVCAALRECAPIPTLPLCLKCAELKNLTDKITKAAPTELIFEKTSLLLSVELEINKKNCSGSIELCKFLSENHLHIEEKMQKIQSDCAVFLSKIKKISPFRIVELENENFENGRKWRVLSEKWRKLSGAILTSPE